MDVAAVNRANFSLPPGATARLVGAVAAAHLPESVPPAPQFLLAARFCARAQESRRPTVRLKTGASGVETGSGQK